MSELTISPELALTEFATKKEAEAATLAFVKKADVLRHDLLDLFLRNAHGKLGYDAFDAYAAERLNIQMDKQALYHMREWAKVERTIAINSPASSAIALLESGQHFVKLPRDTARELAKLPEATQQREAYEQMQALRQHGLQKPNEYMTSLKRIVARMLKGEMPDPITPPELPQSQPMPNAFEQAAQQSAPKETAKPEPPQKPAAPKPPTASVTSFTPAADPDPDQEFTMQSAAESAFDFEGAAEALNTALTWIENEQVDGGRRNAQLVACTLVEIARWIEKEA